MTGVQQFNNVRITRARAAKSTSNNDIVSGENQLPPAFPPVGQRKTRKRPAPEDSTTQSLNDGASPAKHRAVLGDVTNIYNDEDPVNCLPRVKTRKVASLVNNTKGKCQGIIENVDTDTHVTEIQKDMTLVPCNSKDDFSNNDGFDEKNSDGENVQDVKPHSKYITTAADSIPVQLQCKQPVAEIKIENASYAEEFLASSLKQQICPDQHTSRELKNISKAAGNVPVQLQCKQSVAEIKIENASSADEVLASSLKQQICPNQQTSRELKNISKQGVPGILAKSREGAGCSSRSQYIDIDLEHGDPQMCTAYATEIYDNLRIIELKRRPSPRYIETIQQEINANMRGILVDWLVEVAEEYKLVPDTLYLTVSYIDRFLSANVVNRQRLQLLGVTCMLVASKYEEICAPHVEEFCYITDNTYTREEVLEMEIDVLTYLRYDLTTPTTKSFLRRFARAAQTSYKAPSLHLEFMGNYLAELTLVEYDFLHYVPSMIAASAVFVARMTLDPGTHPWNSTLEHYTGYKVSEMKDCIDALHNLQLNSKGCALTAVREKYRQHKFKCVANLSPPLVISQFLKDQ